MRQQEKTMQQIDPLAAGTSWDSTVVIAITAWVYAVIATITDFRLSQFPLLLAGALGLLTVALLLHLWFAMASHAPYRRLSFAIVITLTISAGALQVASMGVTQSSFVTEWGPVAVALVFASASGYRPLSDQYYAGLAAVLTLSLILVLVGIQKELPLGIAYFAVSGITLIAIVVLGQASYTMQATKVLSNWLKNTPTESTGARSSISVKVKSVEKAERFMLRILESGRISFEDTEQATKLSGNIRAELLALSSQTWLDVAGYHVTDPDKIVESFDISAQSTLLALLERLEDINVDNLKLSFTQDAKGSRISAMILGNVENLSTNKLRSMLSAYLRVMYVVFDDVRLISHDGQVKVMFYYAR